MTATPDFRVAFIPCHISRLLAGNRGGQGCLHSGRPAKRYCRRTTTVHVARCPEGTYLLYGSAENVHHHHSYVVCVPFAFSLSKQNMLCLQLPATIGRLPTPV